MTTTVSNSPLSSYDVAADVIDGAQNQWFVARPFSVRIDESSTTSYYGWAVPGTAGSAAGWRMMRRTVSSTVSTYEWADGNSSFDNIWDNRASLSYS